MKTYNIKNAMRSGLGVDINSETESFISKVEKGEYGSVGEVAKEMISNVKNVRMKYKFSSDVEKILKNYL